MNILRLNKAASRRWTGSAVVLLLIAGCASVSAQQGRDTARKKRADAAPAGDTARPAQQTPPAANPAGGQGRQQSAEHPARQNPTQGQDTGGQAARPNRQDSGQSAQPTQGRPNRSDTVQSNQPTQVRPNRSDTVQSNQPTQGRPNRSDTVQSNQPTQVRPNRSDTVQSNQQNPARTDRQNAAPNNQQNPARTDRQNAAPDNRQNPVRTDRQNATPDNRQNPVRTDRQNAAPDNQQNPARTDRQNAAPDNRQNPARTDRQNAAPDNRQNPVRTDRQNQGQPGRDAGRPGSSVGGQNNRPDGGRNQPGSRDGGSPQVVRTPGGGMVHRDSGGQVREVRTPGGAVITHRSDGFRRVEMARPGNRTVVTDSHGRGGYIQRPFVVSNHQYIQRTYSFRGVASVRVFRPVSYRGAVMHVYSPMHYYRPGFYAYVYNPWARPIFYDWAWSGRPWYGYYSSYYSPYPSYSSPILWLTDYLIGSVLERGYEARVDMGGFAMSGQPGITPDVKQEIADEIRWQLDMERSEGQSQNAMYGDTLPIFAGGIRHVFVASESLEVYGSGGACMITEGDVLKLYGGPPSDAESADVMVLASKGRDCRRGSIASVPIRDLQEMQNDMRATMDQGLVEFQSRHGRSGLPMLPPSAAEPAVNASYATNVTPDANVAGELNNVAQEAERAEQSVVNESNSQGGGAGPITISLGQTMDEVASILGRPDKVVDLGAKRIYVYKDMKITFTDGRVSDVQ